MTRSFTAWALPALVLSAATVAGCNPPTCGPGTKQVQAANGNTQCVPVEQIASQTPCDVFDADAGTGTSELMGGICVSHVKCDPNTTKYDPVSGFCEGTGGGKVCQCPTPIPSGSVCVTGGVVDFQTGMHLMAGGRALRIGVYDPLAFLNSTATPPLAEAASTTDACYALTVAVPSSGLVAVGVQDPVGAAPAMPLAIGRAGAPVVAGGTYNVDAYMVLQSTLDAYGGTYKSMGTYVGCFYNQLPPAPTNLIFNETMPLAGVHLLANMAVPADEKYLKTGAVIDTTLSATGALGCAITAGTGGLNTYTGSPVTGTVTKWQQAPGGTTTGVVFINRFHSCDNAPAGTQGCM